MEKKTTRKVGSMIVALALFGMVGLSVAPSVQATEELDVGESEDEEGACIKVYTDPPGAAVAPKNCETPITNTTSPVAAP